VACTAYRNPALLAKLAVTLDEVSGGRLVLGLGAGWNEAEFRAFGFPFDHLASRFAEALQIIHPLLRIGRVDFTGTYYAAPDCEITPRGPRPAGPPLLLAGYGPRMLRLIARYGDMWNMAYMSRVAQFARRLPDVEAACAAEGRDPATLPATLTLAAAYPDLAPHTGFMEDEGFLTGAPEEIAAGLHAFAAAGVEHVMIHCEPAIPAALDRLGTALRVYRQLEESAS
jgi:alkanesulfonate monooxygenase SsuD/methylene tetrahydromethanopterin reductase-like flavin-dependent oxidoreductase (luciferase family)